MPTVYKVLGQSNPPATTATTLYTVPAATNTVVSTVVIANLSATAATYRIAVRPTADSLANQHYLAYDVPISGNDSVTLTLGLTLSAAVLIVVYASTANLAFSAFGSEIS